jgi:hypothetical protein
MKGRIIHSNIALPTNNQSGMITSSAKKKFLRLSNGVYNKAVIITLKNVTLNGRYRIRTCDLTGVIRAL